MTQSPISFASDIVPILKRQCAACHLTGQEVPGLALHPRGAYSSIVGVKSLFTGYLRVDPGKPDDSYLVMKLEGTHTAKGGQGARMPFGAPPLDETSIGKIREWIASGALNN